jgi:CheY-like chemotaxis protein
MTAQIQVKDLNILVVDDDPDLMEMMLMVLSSECARVFSASNGLEALKVLKKEKIDVVVSDIRMPIMDGIKLNEAMQELPTKPKMIFVTGFADINAEQAKKMGASALINKPFGREEIIRVVSQSVNS